MKFRVIARNLRNGSGGRRALCFALLTLVCGKALAQGSVFYDEPSDTRYNELKEWGAKYVELLDSGVPAAGAATFAFTAPSMNSPLFSPVRAAISIVGEAAGATNCSTTTIQPGVGTVDEELVAYLTMGKITTSLTNTDATTAHLSAIMQSNNAQFTIQGDMLVSEGLTPSVITTVPGAKQYTSVATSTATWISELGTLAPGWAGQHNFAEEGKRQLLGQVSEVDYFENEIRNWAMVNTIDLTTYRVNANFGRYGSLPLIVGVYQSGSDAGFVLIDGITGTVDGPFVSGSAIDPRGLLTLHGATFVSGSGVQVVDAKTGNCVAAAPTWHPITPTSPIPPGYTPRPAVPGLPVTDPKSLPGWPTVPRCFTVAIPASCVCTYEEVWIPGPGLTPAIRVEQSCTCPMAVCTGPVPNQPGLVPAVATCTCGPSRYWQ
jgi:hypothetical protein